MPNVHLQTAATNLQQAAEDLRLQRQQVKDDADNQKQGMEKRINEIKVQQAGLRQQKDQTDSDAAKAQYDALDNRLEEEIKQLERTIATVQAEADKQFRGLDQQMSEFSDLARRLASMA